MNQANYGGMPPQHGYEPQASGPGSPKSANDERTWAMLCHLSTLAGFAFPFGNTIAPLVVWLIKRDESTLVDDQGKEALNFQISMTIYYLLSAVLALVIIGIFLLLALLVFDLVVTILAALAANRGEAYRYPLTIRFIR